MLYVHYSSSLSSLRKLSSLVSTFPLSYFHDFLEVLELLVVGFLNFSDILASGNFGHDECIAVHLLAQLERYQFKEKQVLDSFLSHWSLLYIHVHFFSGSWVDEFPN